MSVVVPFYGTAREGRELADALARIQRDAGDEVIVADNTEDGRFPAHEAPGWLRVVRAPLERSSYYARNLGVEASRAPWLLFLDSDCRPEPDLLDAYFDPPPSADCGIVSGSVVADPGQEQFTARYAKSRRHIDPEHYRDRPGRPAGITANLLVRRAAWAQVGGFQEGVRSGADIDFCWRVQDAGWSFDWRTHARAAHLHVDTIEKLLRKAIRHAGGGSWVNRHHPGAFPRPPLARGLLRSFAGMLVWLATGRIERGLFKLVDGLFLTADGYGRLAGNRAARDPLPPASRPVVVVAERFPAAPGDAVALRMAALSREGADVRVEASTRPPRPDAPLRRALHTTYGEDDGRLAQLQAAAALWLTRPLATLRATRASGPGLLTLAPAACRIASRGEVVAPAGDDALARAHKLALLAAAQLEHPGGDC